MTKVDVIVIGGGPGGYLAAERAAQGGKAVVLIESHKLGGVCLNEGCIPSKTFLNSAKLYDYARGSADYGVITKEASLDHQQVLRRKEKVVNTLVGGVTAKLKNCGVKVIYGQGSIYEKTADGIVVEVTHAVGKELDQAKDAEANTAQEMFLSDKVIIATGSTPIIPPIPGLKEGVQEGFVITNREIFELTKIPKTLVIIGGGVIGLEMASYFAQAGTTVTVIEMAETIIPAFDQEISNALLKELKKKGINFFLSGQVTKVQHGADGQGGMVTYQKGEDSFTLAADYVLCAIGRKPVIEGIGLEKANIYTEKGAVVTDDQMRTNVSGIYAVGDVNEKYMLAHTAYREAEVAVNHILGKKDFMRYEAVPSVIYTYPEVACVGKTKEQAEMAGMSVKSITTSFKYSGRYLAEVDKGSGFCKIIVDTKRDCIVGVHMIGSYVSEMVYGVTHMIEAQTLIEQIKETIFPHPTVCEVIREALFEL